MRRILPTVPTIKDVINEGARRLEHSNASDARRTAGVLLAHQLGVDRSHLFSHWEASISDADYETFLRMIKRRAAGEPLQYITGHQEFYRLDFLVTPDVLIPRPETEFLVDQVIRLSRSSMGAGQNDRPLIADIGTGSGCIAVALAVNIPGSRVIATDISPGAIEVARKNAERNGVRDRIEFLSGDLFSPLVGRGLEESIDIIASNPPYVDEGKPDLVQREVREWEPREALFGGVDGLDFYRRLISEAPAFVKPSGCLVFEIGFSQLDLVKGLIKASRWKLIDVTRDLQGIPRTLTLHKPDEVDWL